MRKIKCIEFPDNELSEKRHDEASYVLDVKSETLHITYKGKFYNFLFKNKAPYLMKLCGKQNLHVAANIFMPLFELIFICLLFLSLLVPFSFMFMLMPSPLVFGESLKNINFFPGHIINSIFFGLLLVTLLIGFIGTILKNVDKYCKDTFCQKCGKDFAYEEIKEPEIKETSTFEDYIITITRHWRCKHCGDEILKTEIMDIYKHKGEKSKVPAENCKKCGNKSTINEYKKPDIKELRYKDTIIRHYKCTYCNHHEIMINEESSLFLL